MFQNKRARRQQRTPQSAAAADAAAATLSKGRVTYMAVVLQKRRLGVAYYNSDTGVLTCIEDTPCTAANVGELLSQTLMEVNPNKLILQARDKDVLEPVVSACNVEGCAMEIEVRPRSEFELESARRRIMALNLPEIPVYFTAEERTIRMSFLAPDASERAQMVRALGAVLAYLMQSSEAADTDTDTAGNDRATADHASAVTQAANTTTAVVASAGEGTANGDWSGPVDGTSAGQEPLDPGTSSAAGSAINAAASTFAGVHDSRSEPGGGGSVSFSVGSAPVSTPTSRTPAEAALQAEFAHATAIVVAGVSAIEVSTLVGTMVVPADTYAALQIFHYEAHPSSHKAGGVKEGLSLYGVLNRTKSPMGARLLRHRMYHPLTDAACIRQRLDIVSFFVISKDVQDTAAMLWACVRDCRPLTSALRRMKTAYATASDWRLLRKSCAAMAHTGHLVRQLQQKLHDNGRAPLPLLDQLASNAGPPLEHIAQAVARIVDAEETQLRQRLVVKPLVNEQLDTLKRRYNALPELLTEAAQAEIGLLDERVSTCNTVYLPQLGFLVSIPSVTAATVAGLDKTAAAVVASGSGGTEAVEGLLGIPGLEFMFTSNSDAFYKSPRMRELDNKLGDSLCDIIDLEQNIAVDLQTSVLQHEDMLVIMQRLLAELDVALALAQCARENGYTRPEVLGEEGRSDDTQGHALQSQQQQAKQSRHLQQEAERDDYYVQNGSSLSSSTTPRLLEIHGGRHVLQELCVSQFVPNDLILSAEPAHSSSSTNSFGGGGIGDHTMGGLARIVTGANGSGKSVYLKQAGLIVFMAQIGSFVPAKRVRMGVFDRIITRVHSRESVSIAASTFLIDLNQMAVALSSATPHSLVIVDEFGKGTTARDGVCLLAACLQNLLNRGPASCPLLLVCTHFFELFHQRLLTQSPLLAYKTMQVMEPASLSLQPRCNSSSNTTTPTAVAAAATSTSTTSTTSVFDEPALKRDTGSESGELVFLYHVVDGTATASYASEAARRQGIPAEIVARGIEVTRNLAAGRPMAPNQHADRLFDQRRHHEIVMHLLETDLDAPLSSLKTLLTKVQRLADI